MVACLFSSYFSRVLVAPVSQFCAIGLVSLVSGDEHITLHAMITLKDNCSVGMHSPHIDMTKSSSTVKQEGRLVVCNQHGTSPTLRPRELHKRRGGKMQELKNGAVC